MCSSPVLPGNMAHQNPLSLKAALGVSVCCVLFQCYQYYEDCHRYLSGIGEMLGVMEVLAPLLLLPHLSSAASEECLPAKVTSQRNAEEPFQDN